MINVDIFRRGEDILGFSCKGHAGYAEEGKDIVCSAVSVLVETTANGLTGIAGLPFEVTDDGKEVRCILKGDLDETQKHDAQLLLKTFEMAVNGIREAYGQFLKITDRRK